MAKQKAKPHMNKSAMFSDDDRARQAQPAERARSQEQDSRRQDSASPTMTAERDGSSDGRRQGQQRPAGQSSASRQGPARGGNSRP